MEEETLQKILIDAKSAYKESIKIENELLENLLLNIMGHTQSLLNKSEINSSNKDKEIQEEIQKVKRKVPRWLQNPSQYNYRILSTFMNLSNNNTIPVDISLLERYANIENNKFLSHFNQMKIIAPKNHAKVFQEEHGEVKLWEPVADFIVELSKKQF